MSKEAAEKTVAVARGSQMRPHEVSDLLISAVQTGAATPAELLEAAENAKRR